MIRGQDLIINTSLPLPDTWPLWRLSPYRMSLINRGSQGEGQGRSICQTVTFRITDMIATYSYDFYYYNQRILSKLFVFISLLALVQVVILYAYCHWMNHHLHNIQTSLPVLVLLRERTKPHPQECLNLLLDGQELCEKAWPCETNRSWGDGRVTCLR